MIDDLLKRQNPDGGWGYRAGGGSWTEPSCYAVLALLAGGLSLVDGAVRRGAAWIAARQNPDGGWAPTRGVSESTWVTALALLVAPEIRLAGAGPAFDEGRAESWILAQTGRESSFWHQLRLRLLGESGDPTQVFEGWPWYPGAAAWVAPTAISILTLEKQARRRKDAGAEERLRQGRAYLLARRCRDGGWNHGSTRALGYDSDSYPETTGMALLALRGVDPVDRGQLTRGIEAARQHLTNCNSLEAASWLTLALLSHGDSPMAPRQAPHGGTNEIALGIIATEALRGRNVLAA
jgi:hypothetical protein